MYASGQNKSSMKRRRIGYTIYKQRPASNSPSSKQEFTATRQRRSEDSRVRWWLRDSSNKFIYFYYQRNTLGKLSRWPLLASLNVNPSKTQLMLFTTKSNIPQFRRPLINRVGINVTMRSCPADALPVTNKLTTTTHSNEYHLQDKRRWFLEC